VNRKILLALIGTVLLAIIGLFVAKSKFKPTKET
jgi:hypothetical protein